MKSWLSLFNVLLSTKVEATSREWMKIRKSKTVQPCLLSESPPELKVLLILCTSDMQPAGGATCAQRHRVSFCREESAVYLLRWLLHWLMFILSRLTPLCLSILKSFPLTFTTLPRVCFALQVRRHLSLHDIYTSCKARNNVMVEWRGVPQWSILSRKERLFCEHAVWHRFLLVGLLYCTSLMSIPEETLVFVLEALYWRLWRLCHQMSMSDWCIACALSRLC